MVVATERFAVAVVEALGGAGVDEAAWTTALRDWLEHVAENASTEEATAEALALCLRAIGCEDPTALGQLDAAEVWLAAGCAEGNPRALSRFDEQYVARLDPALRSLGLDRSAVDEVKQRVRTRLVAQDDDGRIRLIDYAGKGKLFGLVKVTAVRLALDDKRKAARAPDNRPADDRTVQSVMDGDLGPELAVIEEQHRAALKEAFHASIDSLDPKQRGVLRLHLLEGSSIDEIAALYDVHRATAARWLVSIRDALGASTRERLQHGLGLDESRMASLLRVVDSRLDLSLSRVLVNESD